jgi:hypothetical protein
MARDQGTRNEGEGSRSAAKQYNDATEKFAKSGQVKPAADAAKKSLEGDEAGELEKAEEEGKRPAREQRKPS